MAWMLIKSGEPNSALAGHQEWQLDDSSDISNPPAEAQSAAPGSQAWTADFKHFYNKANDGSWPDILSNE